MTYFWGKVPLKADIERHRKAEQKFDAKIAELEDKTDAMSVAALRTYRHLRAQLLASKAEVVSRIGKERP
jgi:hypothetical protein